LKLSLIDTVSVEGSSPFRGTHAAVAQLEEAAVIKLRLSLQPQHSPLNARSTAGGR
jgi:hypothetical protein